MLFSHKFNDVQLIIVVYFLFLLLSFLLLAYAEILFSFIKFSKSNMIQGLTMYVFHYTFCACSVLRINGKAVLFCVIIMVFKIIILVYMYCV